MKIPGGHKLDMAWENGGLTRLTVTLGYEGQARLMWKGKVFTAEGTTGETVRLL